MKPTIQPLGAILYSPNQYAIPVFQRHYSWQHSEWERLWENLAELRLPGVTGNHFMGFLVMVPGLPQPGKITTFHLVDGQQRLTTLSILLVAVRNLARKHSLDAFAEEIHAYYLVHPPKRDNEHYRLFPKKRDNADYIAAINGEANVGGRIGQALKYFEQMLAFSMPTSWDTELRAMFDLLCKRLEFMCATLEHENAYNIFKSLNSTGVPLESADLIRNFVFMHVPPDDQDSFDRDLWRPLETQFSSAAGYFNGGEFSDFFRIFLMSGGRYVKPKATFETFEERYEAAGFKPVKLAKELIAYAGYYEVIRGTKIDASPDVEKALKDLRALDSSTTHPLLFNLFQRRTLGQLSNEELVASLKMLHGFIFRRFICSESSRSYGQLFVKACGVLTNEPIKSLRRFLESKGWPDSLRFEAAFCSMPLYNRGYAKIILESLELANGHKEPADLSGAQIEHIMPQTLSPAWKSDLGAEAEKIHAECLHIIGNLTLSAYNRALYNNPFSEKKAHYAESNIVMTRKLTEHSKWGKDEIVTRGKALAAVASIILSGPAGKKVV